MKKYLAIIFLVTFIVGCDSQTESSHSKKSPEELLAMLDIGMPDIADEIVLKYKKQLDNLEGKCEEPRMRISDFSVSGVQMLKDKKGVNIGNLRFLVMMNESIPPSAPKMKCMEVAAALVTLTDKP